MRVFLFGAGLEPRVRAQMGLGAGAATTLAGYRAVGAPSGLGAVLLEMPEAAVAGEVLPASPGLADVMAVLGHAPIEVALQDGPALAYGRAPAGEDLAAWEQAAWDAKWAGIYRRAVEEIGFSVERHGIAQLRRYLPQLLSRAAAWERARAQKVPAEIRADLTVDDVETSVLARPYLDFFMLEEQWLRFRRFSGGQSAEVKRAAFVMTDAVTVLPYDPARDRVLLVEQFRFGPLARGDRRPWSLEPVAGRIDAGETPEATALREVTEETGLVLERLVPVGGYYPSPGAVSEYIYSFVGLADLSDAAERIGGLASEEEDIRSIILPFERLMAMAASGEAQNGPLLLTAYWLAQNRGGLLPK